MIAHLVLSTIVLAIAMVAARVLPLTARTRHALFLIGLAKFAIPAALFPKIIPTPAAIELPMRVFTGGAARVAAGNNINWIAYAWAAVAMLLFGRWLILRTRTAAAALRTGTAPEARELEALAFARRALKINTPVDLLRSPICEAPAVIRILRATILLPSHACDSLDDDELRTLLLHECAHIARRDNLVSAIETLAGALLWFHPLVWLALRGLASTREEACDELVADAAPSTDTYLSALTKICRAVLVSRTAGASCMASAHLSERIEHLMSYARLKQEAFSHRSVLAIAMIAILTVTAAATALSFEGTKKKMREIYRPSFGATIKTNVVIFHIDIFEVETGRTITTADFEVAPQEWKTIEAKDGARDLKLRARGKSDGSGELMLEVSENGETVQHNLYTFTPKTLPAPPLAGEPISINLRDADLKDVLNTFAALTGYDVAMSKDLQGVRINMDVKDMPWDEALRKMAADHGLTVVIEGKKISVHR
ncbi:MAG TPA: M56 family metallopeptidase [Thermoanaerobaculia bacterium]|nr:M56 family metallopeptidase [Thermoanaerobaculia bacterium]